jgi:hypothetical protein
MTTMESFKGGRNPGKSLRAEKAKKILLDAGAEVTRNEVENGLRYYVLKLAGQTFLFVSKATA